MLLQNGEISYTPWLPSWNEYKTEALINKLIDTVIIKYVSFKIILSTKETLKYQWNENSNE